MLFAHRLATLATVAALVTAPTAWGQTAAPTLAQFKAAQASFTQRLAEAEAGRASYPRLADPATGPTMRTAMDNRALSLIDFSDIGASFPVCVVPATATQAYVAVDITDRDGAFSAPTAEQSAQMGKNAAFYHDELTLSASFMVDCFAGLMGPLAKFWDTLDAPTKAERRDGVVRVRNGSSQVYQGGITILAETAYSLQNKEQMLGSLIRNAPAFMPVMTLAQRGEVITTIDTVGKDVPADMRPRLAKLRATFSTTTCTGLCAA